MRKWQIALGVIAIILTVIMLLTGIVLGVNSWFERYHFRTHSPIEVKLFVPIWIEKRTPIIRSPIPTVTPKKQSALPTMNVEAAEHKPTDQEVANYIASKSWDYGVALRLAKSENFYNLTKSFDCSRTNTNTNGSTDYGLFQINSVHSKRIAKHGWTLEDMKNCYKNADMAFELQQEQGWGIWSAYNNGSYLGHDLSI